MGYQVKWLEENLGITRDMIRNYEKMELIPRNNGGAKSGKARYRDYTWEQVEALWLIRANQAFGFTLREIKEMAYESNLDMRDMIDEKIQYLPPLVGHGVAYVVAFLIYLNNSGVNKLSKILLHLEIIRKVVLHVQSMRTGQKAVFFLKLERRRHDIFRGIVLCPNPYRMRFAAVT